MSNFLRALALIGLAHLVCMTAFAGTTGKIAGTVLDDQTGEPLPGVNVLLEGTSMGAATDNDGYFVILNVPPGQYSLRATFIGYAAYRVSGVAVKIDLTTTINMRLKSEALELGEEVVVVAERPVVVKDISNSQLNISRSQIENIPVAQEIKDVVGLQAGILIGEDGPIIRGGSADETAFVVDGFTQRDERTNLPFTQVSLSAVEEIKVQTGGFNAEYGNIRSGLITVVTREGDRQRYSGSFNYTHSPPAQKHFGNSPFDPNSFYLRPYLDPDVAWTGTGNGAWSENLQNQYESFEGWNEISRRTLADNDPNNDLSPEAAQRVFMYQHRRQGEIVEPDFVVDLGFGGPVPLIGEKLGDLRFFISHRREQDMYLVPLSRDRYADNTTLLKLTTNIKPSMKLTLSGQYTHISGTNDNNSGAAGIFKSPLSIARELALRSFLDTRIFAPEYWAPTFIDRNLIGAKFTHTISSNTFYELSIENTSSRYWTVPNPLRDFTPVVTFGDNYQLDQQPWGFMPFPSSGIDGMRMGVGMSNSRDSSRIATTTAKFDVTSQVNSFNQVKAGIEYVYNDHKIRFGAIDVTLPSNRPSSSWDRFPIRLSAYLQDKLEFKGMIANLGVRVDHSNARGNWYDVSLYDKEFFSKSWNPDVEATVQRSPVEAQTYVSPRLGISHPISDNSKLYFNYGHFYSMPVAERLYTVQRVTDGRLSNFANPSLDLSRTIAYELGYDHNLFNQFLLHLAAYYKDVSNIPNRVRIRSADNSVNYLVANANAYADIRGFEVSLEKRIGGWLSGFINYTYDVRTSGRFGLDAQLENPVDQREVERLNIAQFRPLPQPYFRGNVTLTVPRDFGREISGVRPLANWRLSLLPVWRAGRYSTWTAGQNLPEARNNVQWPEFFNTDLRLSRDFRAGDFNMRFYIDVSNLFNNEIFSFDPIRGIGTGFFDGQDFRDYMNSLLWPEEIAEMLGYPFSGDDKIGDLRPDDVEYDALEPNPQNDPNIAARNQRRRESKSYIDNPNQKWLYYLNPRDIWFGIRLDF